jgi:hypothetical protein
MELRILSAALNAERMHTSLHMKILFAVAGVCLLITVLSSLVTEDLRWQRRIYWGGTAGAALFTSIGAFPNWIGGLGLAAAGVFAMVLAAYFTSSYIKIGGKIYAFHTGDGQPDRPADSPRQPVIYDPAEQTYGADVSAKKLWWLLVPAVGLCSVSVATNLGESNRVPVIAGAAFIVLFPVIFGYASDASWGYRVARGQYVQLVLLGIITAGVFVVLYLLAYGAGRRWPHRFKRSLEQPAPPRPSWDKKL